MRLELVKGVNMGFVAVGLLDLERPPKYIHPRKDAFFGPGQMPRASYPVDHFS